MSATIHSAQRTSCGRCEPSAVTTDSVVVDLKAKQAALGGASLDDAQMSQERPQRVPELDVEIRDKERLARRLHLIEGQMRGIERMSEQDRYCIDNVNEIGAITANLEGVAAQIFDDHVRHFISLALGSGDPMVAASRGDDLLYAVRRFRRAF